MARKAERIDIQIRTDGRAFDTTPATEIARVLRELAADFETDGGPATRRNGRHEIAALYDSRGTVCGTVQIEPDYHQWERIGR